LPKVVILLGPLLRRNPLIGGIYGPSGFICKSGKNLYGTYLYTLPHFLLVNIVAGFPGSFSNPILQGPVDFLRPNFGPVPILFPPSFFSTLGLVLPFGPPLAEQVFIRGGALPIFVPFDPFFPQVFSGFFNGPGQPFGGFQRAQRRPLFYGAFYAPFKLLRLEGFPERFTVTPCRGVSRPYCSSPTAFCGAYISRRPFGR